jgi:hypothetical protein
MMTDWFFDLIFFVLHVAAFLLLVATWQHTRIAGFLFIAGSYVLGMVGRWTAPLAYRFAAGDEGHMEWILPLVQFVYVVVSALAVFGFLDIYRALKRSAAGGH